MNINPPSVLSIIQGLGGNTITGMCRCPAHDDSTPSLHVSTASNGRVLVRCHANCPQEAVIAALRARGLWHRSTTPREGSEPDEWVSPAYEAYQRFKAGWAILRAAVEAGAGSPSAYLRGRGIDIVPANAMLLPAKEARRLCGKGFPAMVLPVVGAKGLVGAHLTFLTRDATKGLKNPDGKSIKKMYGPVKGGYVQLGSPSANRSLIVAEGVETALAASQIADLPAIAALSAPNMEVVEVPACAEVIIAADHDETGTKAAAVLAQTLLDRGHRKVRVAKPDRKGQDWNDALNSGAELDELRRCLRHAEPVEDRGIRAMRADKLLEMTFPAPEFRLRPWLEAQSLVMIHAARGTAKTWLALSVAYAVASGRELLGWPAEKPGRTIYVDGEMGGAALKSRLAKLGPPPRHLWFLTPDQFRARDQGMPDIATPEGQEFLDRMIERHDIDVVILDSVSTLVRSGVENEAESWLPIQNWALGHRWRGRAVILITHDNRIGKPRGSSKREDVLNAMIGLKERRDLVEGDESAFELSFTKSREFYGEDAKTRIVRLAMRDGTMVWTSEAIKDTRSAIREMLQQGIKQAQIARELNLTAGRVSQVAKGMVLADV